MDGGALLLLLLLLLLMHTPQAQIMVFMYGITFIKNLNMCLNSSVDIK
jgi:hypothetical protein